MKLKEQYLKERNLMIRNHFNLQFLDEWCKESGNDLGKLKETLEKNKYVPNGFQDFIERMDDYFRVTHIYSAKGKYIKTI